MTVRELILELHKYPEDHEVYVDTDNEYGDSGLRGISPENIDMGVDHICLVPDVEY